MNPQKITTALALLLSMTALPLRTVASTADNLVRNPSFDIAIEADGKKMPLNWKGSVRLTSVDVEHPPKAIFTLTSDSGVDSDPAARIEGLPGQGRSGSLAEWSQEIRVEPNTEYYFSIYMRGVTITGWPVTVVEERTANHSYSAKPTAHTPEGPKGRQVTAEWQRYTTSFTTSDETHYLVLSLRFQSIGEGWVEFDKVMLTTLPKQ